jgi:hypothetical protein
VSEKRLSGTNLKCRNVLVLLISLPVVRRSFGWHIITMPSWPIRYTRHAAGVEVRQKPAATLEVDRVQYDPAGRERRRLGATPGEPSRNRDMDKTLM